MKVLSKEQCEILEELIEDKIYMEKNINDVENKEEDNYLKELRILLDYFTV